MNKNCNILYSKWHFSNGLNKSIKRSDPAVINMSTAVVSFPKDDNYEVNTSHSFSILDHKPIRVTKKPVYNQNINASYFIFTATLKWLICQTTIRKLAELANIVSCLFINLPTLVSLTNVTLHR